MPKEMTLEERLKDFSAFLAIESLKLLKIQGAKAGGQVAVNLLIGTFLSSYIDTLVTQCLQLTPNTIMNEEENYQFASQNFLALKQLIQSSVGRGLTSGIEKFSPAKLEYICELTVLEDIKNRILN